MIAMNPRCCELLGADCPARRLRFLSIEGGNFELQLMFPSSELIDAKGGRITSSKCQDSQGAKTARSMDRATMQRLTIKARLF